MPQSFSASNARAAVVHFMHRLKLFFTCSLSVHFITGTQCVFFCGSISFFVGVHLIFSITENSLSLHTAGRDCALTHTKTRRNQITDVNRHTCIKGGKQLFALRYMSSPDKRTDKCGFKSPQASIFILTAKIIMILPSSGPNSLRAADHSQSQRS